MKITNSHVYFWGGPFSNFHNCEIEYNGYTFHSSEQVFMYLKAMYFGDHEIAEQIVQCLNPKDAKRLGRKVKGFDEKKWKEGREQAMMLALDAKFSDNHLLTKILLNHKDKIFVEASPYDKIWGVGLSENDSKILDESKWEGLNLLGKCLNKLIEKYVESD